MAYFDCGVLYNASEVQRSAISLMCFIVKVCRFAGKTSRFIAKLLHFESASR